MDTALIERLARLRGIGDAYHDYRGELQLLQPRKPSRRSCAPWAARSTTRPPRRRISPAGDRVAGASSCRRWRRRAGARIGIDINVTAREFGATLVWSVHLEDGSRRDGVTSTRRLPGDLARRGRGLVDHAPALRTAPRSAARAITNCEVEDRRRRRRSLPADRLAAAVLRAAGHARRAGGSGASPCSCTRCARATIGASAISAI